MAPMEYRIKRRDPVPPHADRDRYRGLCSHLPCDENKLVET